MKSRKNDEVTEAPRKVRDLGSTSQADEFVCKEWEVTFIQRQERNYWWMLEEKLEARRSSVATCSSVYSVFSMNTKWVWSSAEEIPSFNNAGLTQPFSVCWKVQETLQEGVLILSQNWDNASLLIPVSWRSLWKSLPWSPSRHGLPSIVV